MVIYAFVTCSHLTFSSSSVNKFTCITLSIFYSLIDSSMDIGCTRLLIMMFYAAAFVIHYSLCIHLSINMVNDLALIIEGTLSWKRIGCVYRPVKSSYASGDNTEDYMTEDSTITYN